MESNVKKVILIGAGLRGMAYTDIMADKVPGFKVVAVAEPVSDRRKYVQNKHGIPDEMCFESWEGLLALGKVADYCIVATMDRDHTVPAVAAIKTGYDLLLEKPIAHSLEDCLAIEKAAKEHSRFVLVCHVLRYTPFFRLLKKLICDGEIGDIINIQHNEGVGNVHQSHSFVRGNWGNSDVSSSMILQKSCHDMDILQWLVDKECKRVQSFGSLMHFTSENAPEGAPEFCIDGCPKGDECPYNAVKLYLKSTNRWFRTSATKLIEPGDEDVEKAIRTTNYGRCVYKCPNNVVDHQVVNLEFDGGITATFSMCAFNKGSRNVRIMGTKGEIIGNMGEDHITIYRFSTGKNEKVPLNTVITDQTLVGGHGGGDTGIILALASISDPSSVYRNSIAPLSTSLKNHKIAFAAEESRLTGKVVTLL